MTTQASIRELTADEIAAVSGADGGVAGGFLPTLQALTVLTPQPPTPILPGNPIIPGNPIFGLNPATPVVDILFNVGT